MNHTASGKDDFGGLANAFFSAGLCDLFLYQELNCDAESEIYGWGLCQKSRTVPKVSGFCLCVRGVQWYD